VVKIRPTFSILSAYIYIVLEHFNANGTTLITGTLILRQTSRKTQRSPAAEPMLHVDTHPNKANCFVKRAKRLLHIGSMFDREGMALFES
jgi:hypothetical protein